ncbi:ComE operon protein 3 [Gottschalkia purinilytica]|uniref:ComE operon protein 3 n=1 Tax=Gottschalkia purinilytica TaxID=1503 RepID=A0A0L0WEX3_GOTPU|nr:MBL fold metallo-hydrolase [Gottschalkia purinilytica]KNF09965.1 ComE operon protein 3 [Gottschalkia purinilytica]
MNKIFKSRLILLFITVILLLSITLSGCNVQDSSNEVGKDQLAVHFIDVGQADSILIQFPNGQTSLIDGGNRDDKDLVVNYIKEQGIKKIDYLIATHPHEDHIGGLPEVINTFEIGKIYMPKKSANTKIFERVVKSIKDKGLKATVAKGGIDIINDNDLKFKIIAPNSDNYSDTNEYSIVNKLEYKNISFLFTGDAEKESEEEMLNLGYNLSSDVLKVGHHGSRTSTSDKFLKAVNPKYGVISLGKNNDYGHPHKEAIDTLKNNNVNILRTDELGTIRIISDGEKLILPKNIESNTVQNTTVEKSIYIGNKNTNVYHSEECSRLPNEKNRVIFNTKEEAEKSGYRPDKQCVK